MLPTTIYDQAPAYTHPFLALVPSPDIVAELQASALLTNQVYQALAPQKADYAYAEGKWTVKELLRHIIDCERVYTYRAFRFAHFDSTPLPGFDENAYMTHARPVVQPLPALIAEYNDMRRSTLALFRYLTDAQLDYCGEANGVRFTARLLGFMAVGHNLHHLKVVETKYL